MFPEDAILTFPKPPPVAVTQIIVLTVYITFAPRGRPREISHTYTIHPLPAGQTQEPIIPPSVPFASVVGLGLSRSVP